MDGIQGNHQPIITNAPPTEQSQKSLRRKLVPNPLILYRMDYGSNHEMQPGITNFKKVTEQHFSLVLFITLCKLILTTERENKILRVTMKKG